MSTDAVAPLPPLDDLLATVRVLALPLVTRFRGVEVREIALFEAAMRREPLEQQRIEQDRVAWRGLRAIR